MGKSSLINAGILPLVEQQKNNRYIPLQIRLRSYNPNVPQNLFEIFNQGLEREKNFIDDIPTNHSSVRKHAERVERVHFIADERLAGLLGPAEHSHVRLDSWPEIHDHIVRKINEYG